MQNIETLDALLQEKANRLYDLLKSYGSLVVAFSGGVDSALICAVGHLALGERMLAVTALSPVETPGDHEFALRVAKEVGFAHRLIDFDDFATPHFAENPPDRCYHCKLARLAAIGRMATELGFAVLAEGSNADDALDYRPGARAVAELRVRSPLAEVGLAKAEIRALARALNVPVWDRPSAPCLATRFPYGSRITPQGLDQVARGEAYLKQLGFAPVRVRHFGDTARLEVAPADVAALAARQAEVVPFFKQLGFIYVLVDLAGYRSGAMNEGLRTTK